MPCMESFPTFNFQKHIQVKNNSRVVGNMFSYKIVVLGIHPFE